MNTNLFLSPDVYTMNDDTPTVNVEVAIGVGALVGIAERGPINQAVNIKSWNQYMANFAPGMDSPFVAGSDLAYCVYGFFQNGGSELVVVRTASASAAAAKLKTTDPAYLVPFVAKDPGAWGNDMKVQVVKHDPDDTSDPNFNVIVKFSTGVVETLENLSNDAASGSYFVNRINAESDFLSVPESTTGSLAVTTADLAFEGGNDGVSDITDADFLKGLPALEEFEDIAYVAIPGQVTDVVRHGVVDWATAQPNTNILPVITVDRTMNARSVKAQRKLYEADSGALVWPWIYATDPLSKKQAPYNVRLVPPEAHFMGIMSRMANKYGVHRAPAGTEALVKGAVSLGVKTTKEDTDLLNPEYVVTLRSMKNYGICVWGARTLNKHDDNFKYVSDITLDAYIKRNCYVLGLPFVFRPNTPDTWSDMQAIIDGFMNTLMQNGSFATRTKATAYYVKCDADLNNIHVAKNDGIMETEIGYAGSKPAEFVVFRIKHTITAAN